MAIMEAMSTTGRRGFFGRLFGGFLAAVGVRSGVIRVQNLQTERYIVTGNVTADGDDGWMTGICPLKKGDVITISGRWHVPSWVDRGTLVTLDVPALKVRS